MTLLCSKGRARRSRESSVVAKPAVVLVVAKPTVVPVVAKPAVVSVAAKPTVVLVVAVDVERFNCPPDQKL